MLKSLFPRSAELQRLENSFQKLHDDIIQIEAKYSTAQTPEEKGKLDWELILLAHFAYQEISTRITRNRWDTLKKTVSLNVYGTIPIDAAYQFTVFRLLKNGHQAGVNAIINRIFIKH
ncbi:hypothetical protein SAMN05518672_10949 [Chitinophaga sp. CF118]|uniref:hypothetical protein n=1 Tax=Chitinophaga sp. CF118 TaxID=1884367 RepID=UPI0008EC2EB4|nr:hypothetical protein [Chitinophaga sp. CF118]SFE67943.1 hypothetical protein SAMN05518672_10949 [Chitinophaga sp. CF118]